MIAAGIDAGMSRIKAVLLQGQDLLASVMIKAGKESIYRTAAVAFDFICQEANLDPKDIGTISATGLGQRHVTFAHRHMNDATCLAKGIHHLWPPARCVLDVGAQKCVAVKCLGGKPLKIRANDRCASGSGRYIEMVADVLGVPLEKLGDAVLRADGCVEVKSTCTVFAESEVITLIHSKEKPEHIIKGAHRALAQRAYTLLLHVDWEEDLCLVGGLGKNKGFVKELETLVGCPVSIPDLADFTAAIGAAIICQERDEAIS